jgi:hypothetical protein
MYCKIVVLLIILPKIKNNIIMKNLLLLVAVFFLYNTAKAQENAMNSLMIATTWKVDIDVLKKSMEPLLNNDPSFKNLKLAEKELALKAVLDSQNMTFNFQKNGTYTLDINSESSETGTYKINTKKKELSITNNSTKETTVYDILTIDTSKMILREKEDVLEFLFLATPKN